MDKRSRSVNEFIRKRLRRTRLQQGLALREVAIRAGIPSSSYACLESGHYAISLENLFRILQALEMSIDQVWPFENGCLERPSREMQLLRLKELIALSGATGGALFLARTSKCKVLLHQALGDSDIEELIHSVEQGRNYPAGLWCRTSMGDIQLLLFLKAGGCPPFVAHLMRRYLAIWKRLFGEDRSSPVSRPISCRSPIRANLSRTP